MSNPIPTTDLSEDQVKVEDDVNAPVEESEDEFNDNSGATEDVER